MKIYKAIVLTVLAAICASCATKLSPTKSGNLYGYTNKKGEWVIEKQYAAAYAFSEGMAKVGISTVKIDSFWNDPMFGYEGYWIVDTVDVIRYSFIHKNDSLLPLMLHEAKAFSDGLAAARLKGKWGYINKAGEWQIEPQYADAKSFEKGKAMVIEESKDGSIWYYNSINTEGDIIAKDQNGKQKPDWFDSIPDWRTLLASGEIYVRLNDYESAFDYYSAAARRIDNIEAEDTMAYLDLCQQLAYLAAMRIDSDIYNQYDKLAQQKIEEVLKSAKTERRRSILLEYIEYLFKLSELRELNLQKNEEIDALERIIDVVERSETEDMKLYWYIEERLEELKE